jgi:hypothetical protein
MAGMAKELVENVYRVIRQIFLNTFAQKLLPEK